MDVKPTMQGRKPIRTTKDELKSGDRPNKTDSKRPLISTESRFL